MLFDSRQIIRINISDDWSASDIATFLHELDYLYNLGLRIVAAATSSEQERQSEMWAEKSDHTQYLWSKGEVISKVGKITNLGVKSGIPS